MDFGDRKQSTSKLMQKIRGTARGWGAEQTQVPGEQTQSMGASQSGELLFQVCTALLLLSMLKASSLAVFGTCFQANSDSHAPFISLCTEGPAHHSKYHHHLPSQGPCGLWPLLLSGRLCRALRRRLLSFAYFSPRRLGSPLETAQPLFLNIQTSLASLWPLKSKVAHGLPPPATWNYGLVWLVALSVSVDLISAGRE